MTDVEPSNEAIACYAGWYALAVKAGHVVDDLSDVIEWLRKEGDYEKSDRIRALRWCLNDAVGYPCPTLKRPK